jgi:hypothetical protein
MALITCTECHKQISDKAPACPHCGAPVALASAVPPAKASGGGMGWGAKLALGALALFVAFLFLGASVSKEEARAFAHQDVVEAECKKMMEDSALGAQRQQTRMICDELKRKAQQQLDDARKQK